MPTASDCTICTETYGGRWRTVGTGVMRAHRRTGARGCRGIAPGAFCAAAPGTSIRGTFAPLTATGTTPVSGTTLSASALPGRSRGSVSLPLASLPPYLRGPVTLPLVDFSPAERCRDRRGGCAVGRRRRLRRARHRAGAGEPLPIPAVAGAGGGALPAQPQVPARRPHPGSSAGRTGRPDRG